VFGVRLAVDQADSSQWAMVDTWFLMLYVRERIQEQTHVVALQVALQY